MDCDEIAHHPKGAAKTDEYITAQTQSDQRTINIKSRIVSCWPDNETIRVIKKYGYELFYRLNVFTIKLPGLGERDDDILPLANHFLQKYAADFGYQFSGINSKAGDYLSSYAWPGNVRELENMMERAIVLSAGKMITCEHLPIESVEHNQTSPVSQQNKQDAIEINEAGLNSQVEQLEKQLIQQALVKTRDNKAAAHLLKISERSLWYKVKKYL